MNALHQPSMPPVPKLVFFGISLAAGALLVLYGLCRLRLADFNPTFAFNSRSAALLGDSWYWRGNWQYHVELDPEGAVPFYGEAIAREPLRVDAWLKLAEVELARGDRESAAKILCFLAPRLARSSTWKWKELLLAYDLRDEALFARAFNFILQRLPHHRRDAFQVAVQFWKGSAPILPRVTRENLGAYLSLLMQERALGEAWRTWKAYGKDRELQGDSLSLRFCELLIHQKMLEEATEVWEAWTGRPPEGAYNGGFEEEPLQSAFGWRLRAPSGVQVRRTSEFPYAGRYALHIEFSGKANVDFHHVSQIVPVLGGRAYRLSFAQRGENLTTDQGVFLQVLGRDCRGLLAEGEAIQGSLPWREEILEIQVPEGCHALMLRIRRVESLKFDNKISGDYWLDEVELIPVPAGAS